MTGLTTRIESISLPVPDQDSALAFYVDVLGFELIWDGEPIAGQRWVEVAPPGSEVHLALLPPDSDFPLGLRLKTRDAEEAYARLRAAGTKLHQDGVIYTDFYEPMFTFDDPAGNLLDFNEEPREERSEQTSGPVSKTG